MMKYRNIKTGAIVDVQSEVSGNWEPVKEQAPVTAEPKKTPAKKKKKEG